MDKSVKEYKFRKIVRRIIFIICLTLMLLFFILPYIIMIGGSLMPLTEFHEVEVYMDSRLTSLVPGNRTIWNYTIALVYRGEFYVYLQNSLIVSLGTMLLTCVLSILAAYGISRFHFKLKKTYNVGLLFTQLIPGITFLLPFYIIFFFLDKNFGIPVKESYIGLILTFTSFSLPFSVLMLARFFNSVPKVYDDQARIDGCSRLQALIRIIAPIASPSIYAIAIYSFLVAWNEILFANILTTPATRTISVGILQISGQAFLATGGPVTMAACVVMTIPLLAIFIKLRKFVFSGMTEVALKK